MNDERRQLLVEAMVTLSHDLGYRVVAEGVETEQAFEFLGTVGCNEAQGYLFASQFRQMNWPPGVDSKRCVSLDVVIQL